MENKQYAVISLFGLDFTSRKHYRRLLALRDAAIASLRDANKKAADDIGAAKRDIDKIIHEWQSSQNALKAAKEDYNKLREALAMTDEKLINVEAEKKQLESAYIQAKRELAKFKRTRGDKGRFVKGEKK